MCSGQDCNGHGQCVRQGSSFVCSCEDGFAGNLCQTGEHVLFLQSSSTLLSMQTTKINQIIINKKNEQKHQNLFFVFHV